MNRAFKYAGGLALAALVGTGTVASMASVAIQRNHLIESEKKKWEQDHTIIYDKPVRDENLRLLAQVFRDGEDIRLAKVDRQFMSVSYEHWFITDGKYYLEFGAASIDLDEARVQISEHPDYQDLTIVESVTTMTKVIRDRMLHVLGMANYSLCLRNCEHVANYVFRGRWISHQMDTDKTLLNFFKGYLAAPILSKVNTFPASIRPHSFDPNEPKKLVYNFIDDGLEASRFEYYLDTTKDTDYTVLLIGPTGAGKSRLINVLFNQEICDSDVSLESVTREVYFIRGRGNILNKQTGQLEQRNIVVADTVGLCDSQWDDEKVLAMIKGRIGCNVRRLDAVLFLFNAVERLPRSFVENAQKVLAWLDYPKNSKRILFLGTKADYLPKEKQDALADQFYRNFIIEKPASANAFEPVQFVGFPAESELHDNTATRMKTYNSWEKVRAFLYSDGDNSRIAVNHFRSQSCCIL